MNKTDKIFISYERSRLIKERAELEDNLSEIESWSNTVTISYSSFIGEDPAEEIVKRSGFKSRLKKLSEKFSGFGGRLRNYFQNLVVDSASRSNDQALVYPILDQWEKHFIYDYIGDEALFFEAVEKVKQQYIAEAVLMLKKKLKNLDRRIRHIIRSLYAHMLDKRAYFRSIVKLLFKNLDDEHNSVNNTTEQKQLNYLHSYLHYGTRKSKEIKRGFVTAAIAT